MADENEFDTPEVYQRDAALNATDAPAPEPEDMGDEPAADAPAAPVVATPATPAPTAPAAAAQVAPTEFDRKSKIGGLHEDANFTPEGLALQTKEILSKEKKVRMMIPLDPGERGIVYRTVSINGYRFDVRKNVMVDLPESVAALLADSYRITNEVVETNEKNLANAGDDKRKALGL